MNQIIERIATIGFISQDCPESMRELSLILDPILNKPNQIQNKPNKLKTTTDREGNMLSSKAKKAFNDQRWQESIEKLKDVVRFMREQVNNPFAPNMAGEANKLACSMEFLDCMKPDLCCDSCRGFGETQGLECVVCLGQGYLPKIQVELEGNLSENLSEAEEEFV